MPLHYTVTAILDGLYQKMHKLKKTSLVAENPSTPKATHPSRKQHDVLDQWTKNISLISNVTLIWVWNSDEWFSGRQRTYYDLSSDCTDLISSDFKKKSLMIERSSKPA